jgi:hypothetical protein
VHSCGAPVQSTAHCSHVCKACPKLQLFGFHRPVEHSNRNQHVSACVSGHGPPPGQLLPAPTHCFPQLHEDVSPCRWAAWLLDGCWMAAGWLLDGCWMAAIAALGLALLYHGLRWPTAQRRPSTGRVHDRLAAVACLGDSLAYRL